MLIVFNFEHNNTNIKLNFIRSNQLLFCLRNSYSMKIIVIESQLTDNNYTILF